MFSKDQTSLTKPGTKNMLIVIKFIEKICFLFMLLEFFNQYFEELG
jgi:hypothetical protein